MLLSEVLPRYDVRTRRSIEIDAPRERVWEALRATTLSDMRTARLLFRLRGLPSDGGGSILELEGFRELAEDPGRELVVGAVGRPWLPRAKLVEGADVRTFREPGYALMALNVVYSDNRLVTETRVRCTDRRSRLWFRLYWLVVGPFSLVVRADWLRAVKRRATA